jgi:hypothetical protein
MTISLQSQIDDNLIDNNLINNHYCIKIKDNNISWCGKQKCEDKLINFIVEQRIMNNFNNDFILIHKEQINMLHNRIDNQRKFIDLLKNNISTLEKDYYKINNDVYNINLFIVIAFLILILSTLFENSINI